MPLYPSISILIRGMPRLYETAPGPGGSGARSVRPPPPPLPARWRAAGGTSPNNGPKRSFLHSIIRLFFGYSQRDGAQPGEPVQTTVLNGHSFIRLFFGYSQDPMNWITM